MSRGRRGINNERTREMPFGGVHSDYLPKILFVCHNQTHRDRVAHVFRDKAVYGLIGDWRVGQRYDKIVYFDRLDHSVSPSQLMEDSFYMRCHMMPLLKVDGELVHYTEEQQQDLGIIW